MNDNNRRYVVGWQSPAGVMGHGETIGRRTAHAWAKRTGEEYPEMLHRVYFLDANGVTLWIDTEDGSRTLANALPPPEDEADE